MIAVDTNILVYAHRKEMPHHERARLLVAGLASRPERWGIPWPCVAEFYAVVTHARLWQGAASTPAQALRQIGAWVGSPSVSLLAETDETWRCLEGLVERAPVRGAAIHDARIAAICESHGVAELYTADRDFSRFPGLRSTNPFATGGGP